MAKRPRIGRTPLSHTGKRLKRNWTGTEMNHIVHGNRDRREQRTPKLLLPNPR
jgi:hypothetical protein